jgi:UDP-glucose 4-epimerase
LRLIGASPPVQAVHVDDLVAALALVVLEDHPGTFNVASDGWLDDAEARAVLPSRVFPPLPAQLVERVLARTWAAGLGDVPPGVVPYVAYPWVVANDRLRGLGWQPAHTNEQAILEGLATLGPPPSRVRAVVLAGAALLGLLAVGGVLRRRRARARARRARSPSPR